MLFYNLLSTNVLTSVSEITCTRPEILCPYCAYYKLSYLHLNFEEKLSDNL